MSEDSVKELTQLEKEYAERQKKEERKRKERNALVLSKLKSSGSPRR